MKPPPYAAALPAPIVSALARETGLAYDSLPAPDLIARLRALHRGYRSPGVRRDAADPAYLWYFLPRAAARISHLWQNILPDSRPRSLLDLGCGPGSAALAVLASPAGEALEKIALVDADRSVLSLASRLCRSVGGLNHPNLRIVTRAIDLSRPYDLPRQETYDLIVASSLMAEMIDPRKPTERGDAVLALWRRLGGMIGPGGALILSEPATREISRAFLSRRDLLLSKGFPLPLLAPCPRPGPCPALPNEQDWCHDTVRATMPPLTEQLGREAGLDPTRTDFSYLVFGKGALPPEGSWRVVSSPIKTRGRLDLWVCNGHERVKIHRLDRDRSAANAAFDDLSRGDLVRFSGLQLSGTVFRLPAGGTVSNC
jgi:SAM-dependent methyltransferase